jgi:hypothetical protein
MTADRVVVLILMVAGFVWLIGFNRRKLARMCLEERARFDRRMAPFARTSKVFLSVVVILGLWGAVGAALDGAWPVSIALVVVVAVIGYGVVYRSRWWLGQ